ncbi:hypothetical protein JAAARDRAFT_190551 [Jaapia argillacea MUCL 33604]|uniref:ZZ-type domain-containing protein n=1 Tax=Jaapia argillacea MUCL 33604 TaxID=933084 RepID=A0A067QE91_9AGAM|nr:hypothetical protein JAAARDRAFT_190551 [Jaapia argillacea MUCL 33604]
MNNSKSAIDLGPNVSDPFSIDEGAFATAYEAVETLAHQDLLKVPLMKIQDAIRLVNEAVDSLGNLHSAIKPVSFAIKAAIELITTSRENERRISTLRLKFRQVKDDNIEIDGRKFRGRMDDVCFGFIDDIKWFGAVMETYNKESRYARLLKYSGWKEIIDQCEERCQQRKAEVRDALLLHGTERKLAEFIQTNGREACLQNDNLLSRLAEIDHYTYSPRGHYPHTCSPSPLPSPPLVYSNINSPRSYCSASPPVWAVPGEPPQPPLTTLQIRRLCTPVSQLLVANISHFESKMDQLSANLQNALHRVEFRLLKAIDAGAHERIIDPVIGQLWKDMHWGGTVDLLAFFVNLIDYYADLAENLPSRGHPSEAPPLTREALKGIQADQWCFKYITVSHSTFLGNVLDEEGTSLVRIRRLNQLIAAKPGDFTMIEWIAYNSWGWIVESDIYRARIDSLLEKALFVNTLARNSATVTRYFKKSWDRVWTLLESASWVPTLGSIDDSRMAQLVQKRMEFKESHIQGILERLSFNIDQPGTFALLGGGITDCADVLESYLWPALYLIILRHCRLVYSSSKCLLDEQELECGAKTLKTTMSTISLRMQSLVERQCNNARPPWSADGALFISFANGIYGGLCGFYPPQFDPSWAPQLDMADMGGISGEEIDRASYNLIHPADMQDEELHTESSDWKVPPELAQVWEEKLRTEYGLKKPAAEDFRNSVNIIEGNFSPEQNEEIRAKVFLELRLYAAHDLTCDMCSFRIVGVRHSSVYRGFNICSQCRDSDTFSGDSGGREGFRGDKFVTFLQPLPDIVVHRYIEYMKSGDRATSGWLEDLWRLQLHSTEDDVTRRERMDLRQELWQSQMRPSIGMIPLEKYGSRPNSQNSSSPGSKNPPEQLQADVFGDVCCHCLGRQARYVCLVCLGAFDINLVVLRSRLPDYFLCQGCLIGSLESNSPHPTTHGMWLIQPSTISPVPDGFSAHSSVGSSEHDSNDDWLTEVDDRLREEYTPGSDDDDIPDLRDY